MPPLVVVTDMLMTMITTRKKSKHINSEEGAENITRDKAPKKCEHIQTQKVVSLRRACLMLFRSKEAWSVTRSSGRRYCWASTVLWLSLC